MLSEGAVFTLKCRLGLPRLAGILSSLSSVVKQNDLEQTVDKEVFNKSSAGTCPQKVYRFTVVPQSSSPAPTTVFIEIRQGQFGLIVELLMQEC